MVFPRPFISNSSIACINPFVIVPRAPITTGITIIFMFHRDTVLLQGQGIYLLFAFFQFYPVVCQDGKVHYSTGTLFVDYHYVWLSGRDLVIRLYLKIPKKFACLIF